MDPANAFLYVANETSNDVWTYSIGPTNGALTLVGSPIAAGTTPRSVAVDPLGQFRLHGQFRRHGGQRLFLHHHQRGPRGQRRSHAGGRESRFGCRRRNCPMK
jgi:hypothetical protein